MMWKRCESCEKDEIQMRKKRRAKYAERCRKMWKRCENDVERRCGKDEQMHLFRVFCCTFGAPFLHLFYVIFHLLHLLASFAASFHIFSHLFCNFSHLFSHLFHIRKKVCRRCEKGARKRYGKRWCINHLYL